MQFWLTLKKTEKLMRQSLGSIDSVPCKVVTTKPTEFLLSTRNIDFGLVKPKTSHVRFIELSNSESYDQIWLIQRKPSDAVPSPYHLSDTESGDSGLKRLVPFLTISSLF